MKFLLVTYFNSIGQHLKGAEINAIEMPLGFQISKASEFQMIFNSKQTIYSVRLQQYTVINGGNDEDNEVLP